MTVKDGEKSKPIPEVIFEEKPLNKDEVESDKTKTLSEKLEMVKDNITVEPLLAGLIIPSIISRFAMTNLNLDKACRVSLQLTETICESLIKRDNSNFSIYEKDVQKVISGIDIWKGVIHTLIPCILIMFMGAWSDRTGKRKMIILLPIFGEFVTSVSNIVNVYFFYEIPVEVTVFLETIFPAITGGWVTMFLGVFAYISDITTEEARTFRVGMVNFCMTVGVPVGIALSGVLIKYLGYYSIFSSTCVMFFLVLCYGIFCLKEPDQILAESGLPLPKRKSTQGVSFFNLNHVLDTISVAYKKREGNKRSKVILTLFVVFILYGPSMSEHSVTYLFVRNTLNWDMVQYSLLISYSIVLHSFGALFSITVLSRRLQVDDSLLCLISCSSKFVGSIWTAFVKTSLEMYLVPVIEILNATTFTSLRSIMSKLADKEENAKVNSLFSLVETVAALLFNPLYSWTYMKTLQVLPGTVFLISAASVIPAAVILILFYVQNNKKARQLRKRAFEAENKKEKEAEDKKEKETYDTTEPKEEEAMKTQDTEPKVDPIPESKKVNETKTQQNQEVHTAK